MRTQVGTGRWPLACAVIICFGAGGAARGQQVFTDRAAFLGAAGQTAVIDFEEFAIGPADLQPVTGAEWAPKGVTFHATRAGATLAVGGGGGADKNLFVNQIEDSDVTSLLASPGRAFGLTIFDNTFHTAAERIVFFDAAGGVLADVEMPRTPDLGRAFVGLVTASPLIARVETREDADGDFVGIGEVIVPAVPEPAASALLLGALAAALKRRRRQ